MSPEKQLSPEEINYEIVKENKPIFDKIEEAAGNICRLMKEYKSPNLIPVTKGKRKKIVFDQRMYEIVENYMIMGATEEYIYKRLGISDKSWRNIMKRDKILSDIVENAKEDFKQEAIGILKQKIRLGDNGALSFFLKNPKGLNWTEKTEVSFKNDIDKKTAISKMKEILFNPQSEQVTNDTKPENMRPNEQ